jgi:hypothetical protein
VIAPLWNMGNSHSFYFRISKISPVSRALTLFILRLLVTGMEEGGLSSFDFAALELIYRHAKVSLSLSLQMTLNQPSRNLIAENLKVLG